MDQSISQNLLSFTASWSREGPVIIYQEIVPTSNGLVLYCDTSFVISRHLFCTRPSALSSERGAFRVAETNPKDNTIERAKQPKWYHKTNFPPALLFEHLYHWCLVCSTVLACCSERVDLVRLEQILVTFTKNKTSQQMGYLRNGQTFESIVQPAKLVLFSS